MSEMTLHQLQEEQAIWVAHNFPDARHYHPLLGMTEELGELAHTQLKYEQHIREYAGEDARDIYTAKAEDALGDLLVYAADFATRNGLDLQRALETTWGAVKQRDWRADPVSAHVGHGA